MNINSKLIEEAVDQFATLPGVGRKTALRLVLNLLKRSPQEVERFSRCVYKPAGEYSFLQKLFQFGR
jgi:recombinational DNA repair protein RecR